MKKFRLFFLGTCIVFALISTFTAYPQSTSSAKKTAMTTRTAPTESTGGAPKIWLSLDVVEIQSGTSGAAPSTGERYRSDVEINVVDSASGKTMYTRAGSTVTLLPRRTYYVMLNNIPQRAGYTTTVAGQQSHIIRTPSSVGASDVMYERKFMLSTRPSNGRAPFTATDRKMPQPSRSMPSSMPQDMDIDNGGRMNMIPPNYYVIQYSSLRNQTEAIETKRFLLQNGIRDARVEIYIDRNGMPYYRIRSGSYPTIPQAKEVVERSLWANRTALNLRQKPIIVRAGI